MKLDDLKNYLLIAAGAFIFAFGLNFFLVANRLAEGGVTGISLILFYLFQIPIGATILALNVPLFIIGWRLLGRGFAVRTVFGVVMVSLFVEILGGFREPTDPLLAALYGGALTGLGLGLIFRAGGTTGGSDILARILWHFRGLEMGRTIFALDVLVVSTSGLLFGRNQALYTLVAMFVASRVIDTIQQGLFLAKAVIIVSDQSRQIADRIMTEMERGTTILEGKGGYTSREKEILYCVVTRGELTRLKLLVREVDPAAFVVVQDAGEVLGEGFFLPPVAQFQGRRRR